MTRDCAWSAVEKVLRRSQSVEDWKYKQDTTEISGARVSIHPLCAVMDVFELKCFAIIATDLAYTRYNARGGCLLIEFGLK